MIYSYELERRFLCGLLKHPNIYSEICNILGPEDFYDESSSVNKTLFYLIRKNLEKGESVDEVVLSETVKSLNITFEDNIDPYDYISSIAMQKISYDASLNVAKELKKLSVRRHFADCGSKLAKKMRSLSNDASYDEIVDNADKIYNNTVDLFEVGDKVPVNIYDEMEAIIEDRGENPIEEFGLRGPHPRIQQIYGSLCRPGNITVIVARSGVGKTQFCMDFATKVSFEHNVPVLHFDNGEMSKEELIMRQCAALSGVPLYLLETGNWRRAGKEIVEKVRSVWPRLKKTPFYYYGVGGMTVDEMVGILKRFYYSQVGRGNELLFSFDYIKATNSAKGEFDWSEVGMMLETFKKTIKDDLHFNGDPMVSMISSIQSNRGGITTNRSSDTIVEDESVVGLSDMIIQLCSHMFLMRKKTLDEVADDPRGFGTHKLINLKARHLGRDIEGALEPVKMPDGSLKKNCFYLDINNFNVTERGDLRDLVKAIDSASANVEETSGEDGVPNDWRE